MKTKTSSSNIARLHAHLLAQRASHPVVVDVCAKPEKMKQSMPVQSMPMKSTMNTSSSSSSSARRPSHASSSMPHTTHARTHTHNTTRARVCAAHDRRHGRLAPSYVYVVCVHDIDQPHTRPRMCVVVFIYCSSMIYYVYIEIYVVSHIHMVHIYCISTLNYIHHPSYLHPLVFPRVSFSDTAQLSMMKCVDTIVHATSVRTATRRTREHPSVRGGLLRHSRIRIEAK